MILTILDDGEALLSTVLLMMDSIILPKIYNELSFKTLNYMAQTGK